MINEIWFWQTIVCPLWTGLAASVAELGVRCVFVAQQPMSTERLALGWSVPSAGAAEVLIAPTAESMRKAAADAPPNAVHVTQGVRSHGLVAAALEVLLARRARILPLFETIDDAGWRGPLKKLLYRRLLGNLQHRLGAVLAIGERTPEWVRARGIPPSKIVPFAYFLDDDAPLRSPGPSAGGRFRFLFIGQLVERKRLDILIDALGDTGICDVELEVIGSGSDAAALQAHGQTRLGDRLRWTGLVERSRIPACIAAADALVLPSRHDGWGAVVCEAIMAGVPAIASDRCGTAGIVRMSGRGGVFPAGDRAALTRVLQVTAGDGKLGPAERRALADWGRCVGSRAGATYLVAIASHVWEGAPRPTPPWASFQRLAVAA